MLPPSWFRWRLLVIWGAVYVAVAWHVARRFGERWLVATWLVAALLLWVVTVKANPLPPRLREYYLYALISSLGGFGLATLSLRKRLRRSHDGVLTLHATAAGVGALIAGQLVGTLPVIASDLSKLLRLS